MKLSYDWLQDFARFDSIPFARIIEKIALSICEVDEIEEYKEFLQDVRIVSVEKIEKHPQADKLSICQVSDGTNTHTVVTAATNIQQSNHVPLAIPGASIAGKQIQKASLRGVESFGMFVSGKEIEINEDNSGVWILPEDSPLGTSIREYYSCNDKIFHIDNKSITHRPDLWSHFGFARELAAQLSLPIDFDPFQARFAFSKGKTIAVKQNNNAHSYYACLLENIQVQPSQEKISKRLEKCGINTINNVVDISNYVMLEMGQPTHFFDKQTLASVELEVSLSQKGEAFLLLDDSKPELVEGLPLIRNQNVPVAVAGVMGSKESSVQDTSKELILESAVFKRETIRKSIRATGIRSEASMRYEKGLDSSLSLPVLNRTLFLLQENGCPELICYFPAGFNNQSAKTIKIITSVAFINRKLGKALEAKEIVSILKRLHFMVKRKEDTLEIIVPKFRHNYDVTIPEDIVEEVGRSLEYSTIQPFPLSLEVKPPAREYKRELERKLKFSFSAKAFTEVFTYSFCSAKENQFEDKDAQGLALQ
ncbi:MAG: phenylalanine--tRNA ligase subunit beta, partial [Spirochaetota bacterium]